MRGRCYAVPGGRDYTTLTPGKPGGQRLARAVRRAPQVFSRRTGKSVYLLSFSVANTYPVLQRLQVGREMCSARKKGLHNFVTLFPI
jgi:hypothetical protein